MDNGLGSFQEKQRLCSQEEKEKSRADAWAAWIKERDETVVLEDDGIVVTLAMVFAGEKFVTGYSGCEPDFEAYAQCYIEMEKKRRRQFGR